MSTIEVTILLATYNGGAFLREQLDSIITQTHFNWKLLISDDASNDDTLVILREYAARYNHKITILPASGENLGSVANFSRLFNVGRSSDAKYIMFCDQDDCWLPNKIECTLDRMLMEEAQNGNRSPLLVHTNFTYSDAHLQPIAGKAKFHARKMRHLSFPNLIIQNPVYGCTAMLNKALVDKIYKIPLFAENHDFWIALVASAFGKIVYIPEATMLYRQHGANISTHHDNNKMIKRIKRVFVEKRNLKDLERKKIMIIAFSEIYSSELSLTQQEVVRNFLAFLDDGKPSQAIINLRSGVRMQTASQTTLFYLTVMLAR